MLFYLSILFQRRKNPHPIVAAPSDKDGEYKLQFQNLEQKREIRFLTKAIEEMQLQVIVMKVRESKHIHFSRKNFYLNYSGEVLE